MVGILAATQIACAQAPPSVKVRQEPQKTLSELSEAVPEGNSTQSIERSETAPNLDFIQNNAVKINDLESFPDEFGNYQY